jgi:hypothetical protein
MDTLGPKRWQAAIKACGGIHTLKCLLVKQNQRLRGIIAIDFKMGIGYIRRVV